MRRLAALALFALGATGCLPRGGSCRDQPCTELFASITVTVFDGSGQRVGGLSTRTVYVATGEIVFATSAPNESGSYVVVDDTLDTSRLRDGSEHAMQFIAESVQGIAMGDYVIRAGECECHVGLVSGPSNLTLQ